MRRRIWLALLGSAGFFCSAACGGVAAQELPTEVESLRERALRIDQETAWYEVIYPEVHDLRPDAGYSIEPVFYLDGQRLRKTAVSVRTPSGDTSLLDAYHDDSGAVFAISVLHHVQDVEPSGKNYFSASDGSLLYVESKLSIDRSLTVGETGELPRPGTDVDYFHEVVEIVDGFASQLQAQLYGTELTVLPPRDSGSTVILAAVLGTILSAGLLAAWSTARKRRKVAAPASGDATQIGEGATVGERTMAVDSIQLPMPESVARSKAIGGGGQDREQTTAPSSGVSALAGDIEARCPFCAELVQPAAKKCKHCGEWFHAQPDANQPVRPVVVGRDGPPLTPANPQVFEGLSRTLRLFPDRFEISPNRNGVLDSLNVVLDGSTRVVSYRQIQSIRLREPGKSGARIAVGVLQILNGEGLAGMANAAMDVGVLQIGLAGIGAVAPDDFNLSKIEQLDPYAIVFDRKKASLFADAAKLLQERVAQP